MENQRSFLLKKLSVIMELDELYTHGRIDSLENRISCLEKQIQETNENIIKHLKEISIELNNQKGE